MTARTALVEETIAVGATTLALLRPHEPEALIDPEEFEHDEFLPYWAELWPAGLALARALPDALDGARIVELGCGLGVPSLVAAARGAEVTAVDWARDAVEVLERNAARNRLALRAVHADWRGLEGAFDLVLAADVLYEERYVRPLLETLPRLAPEALLAEPGRPHAAAFLDTARRQWAVDEVADRVHRLRFGYRTVQGG